MKNNSENLLGVMTFGKDILGVYKDKSQDREIYSALLILLNIESILDKGRIFLNSPDSQIRSEINKGMDEIRAGILTLMKSLDKAELKSFLSSVGEEFKTNFISNL